MHIYKLNPNAFIQTYIKTENSKTLSKIILLPSRTGAETLVNCLCKLNNFLPFKALTFALFTSFSLLILLRNKEWLSIFTRIICAKIFVYNRLSHQLPHCNFLNSNCLKTRNCAESNDCLQKLLQHFYPMVRFLRRTNRRFK